MLFACAAAAQVPKAASAPATTAPVATAAISFELDWPQADPSWFSITIAADGTASYRSKEKLAANEQADDAYVLKFIATEDTRNRIFELAKTLKYFHGDFEYRSGNIAKTGKKTLRYLNGPESSETSLNFSTNTAMMDLVGIFQKIATTIELGRLIEFKLRFDKLGLDADLKGLEGLSNRGALLEIQSIEPVLRRTLTDQGTMNISRQRIQRILNQSAAK